MSGGNINPALAGGSAVRAGGAGSTSNQQPLTAQFKGETVSLLPTPEAILADSAEELTFSFSEIVQKKEISKRNMRSGAKTFSAELARKYLERVPDLDQDGALQDWLKEWRQLPRPLNPETLLTKVEQHFGDPSHAFLALSYTLELLEHEAPDAADLAPVRAARDSYYDRHGEAIEAGINVSPEVNKTRYADLGKPQQLRDTYRDVVLDYDSIGTAYEKIIADFSGKPLAEAISFLLASLSADIHASQRDSSRSIKLQRIVSDLYQVKQINTMHKACENLLQRCHKLFQSKPPDENGLVDRMLAFVIELKGSEWQSEQVLDKALAATGLDKPVDNIYFLQGFKEIARLIPMKIFDDKNQRERMLESMQQRIDLEVANEEAELEQ